MLTTLFNQLFKFWGNPQPVKKQPSPDELRKAALARDEQDIEDIVMVLNCFLRCQP